MRVECGLMMRRPLRQLLEELRFTADASLEWIEHKGFMDSVFLIKGSPATLAAIYRTTKRWEEEGQ